MPLKVVAAAVSCSVSTLSRIESGAVQPSRETARGLYHFFDRAVPLAHIYDPVFAAEAEPVAIPA
jgi:transcriptional regulator with XRE-family HTH domain